MNIDVYILSTCYLFAPLGTLNGLWRLQKYWQSFPQSSKFSSLTENRRQYKCTQCLQSPISHLIHLDLYCLSSFELCFMPHSAHESSSAPFLLLFTLGVAGGSCTCKGVDALVGVEGPGDTIFSAAVGGWGRGCWHGWQTELLNIATSVANVTSLFSSWTAFGCLSVDWSKWINTLSPVTVAYSFIFLKKPVWWLYRALDLAVPSFLYSVPIIEKYSTSYSSYDR